MKCKDLIKLSKKALIKHLKAVQSENWKLFGQIVQKDEEIGELLAVGSMVDEAFSQIVHKNLVKIERLEVKLTQYQAQFGELDKLPNDNVDTTPQERGKIERLLTKRNGELLQRRVSRGCLHINNQRYFDEALQDLHGELLAVRDTGDGYEVYRANNLLCKFDKITTDKE